jgi:hypothetical protein
MPLRNRKDHYENIAIPPTFSRGQGQAIPEPAPFPAILHSNDEMNRTTDQYFHSGSIDLGFTGMN